MRPGPYRAIVRRRQVELHTLECGHVLLAEPGRPAKFGRFCPYCREEEHSRRLAAASVTP